MEDLLLTAELHGKTELGGKYIFPNASPSKVMEVIRMRKKLAFLKVEHGLGKRLGV